MTLGMKMNVKLEVCIATMFLLFAFFFVFRLIVMCNRGRNCVLHLGKSFTQPHNLREPSLDQKIEGISPSV